jgi:muconate cycloisomerase
MNPGAGPAIAVDAAPLPPVEAIDVREVCVPRRHDNRIVTSYATLPDAHHAVVTVRAAGLVGVGEAPAERWWTGEDAASVRNAIERYLAPALIGRSIGVRAASAAMEGALADNPYAKAAIEMALWDLLGKIAGLPLYALLGGGPPHPVPIKYGIGLTSVEHAREQAARGLELGFGYLKVKVGGSLRDDLARVAVVREVAGDRARIGVDANGGWSHVVAIEALQPLKDLSVSFLEQPVSHRFPAALVDVTRRSAIPVVAHESLRTFADGLAAAESGLAHIWALTPSTHGGLVATLDLLGVARAAGIPCLLGSTVELGIATAFMAHIGAAFAQIAASPVPSDVIGPFYHEGDIVAGDLTFSNGEVAVGAAPGLGVELDPDQLERYGVDA